MPKEVTLGRQNIWQQLVGKALSTHAGRKGGSRTGIDDAIHANRCASSSGVVEDAFTPLLSS